MSKQRTKLAQTPFFSKLGVHDLHVDEPQYDENLAFRSQHRLDCISTHAE